MLMFKKSISIKYFYGGHRNMKKFIRVFVICFAIFILASCAFGNVALTLENFPDENFCQVLSIRDSNLNSILDASEIEKIKTLTINYRNIDSLEGIKYLSSLENLSCSDNNLTELDVSGAC